MEQDYGARNYNDGRGGHEESPGPSLATILWEMHDVDGENLSDLPENLSPDAMEIWERALDAIASSE